MYCSRMPLDRTLWVVTEVADQGSSFHVEDINTIGDRNRESRVVSSMVFEFPMTFDRKVVNAERHDDTLKASTNNFMSRLYNNCDCIWIDHIHHIDYFGCCCCSAVLAILLTNIKIPTVDQLA